MRKIVVIMITHSNFHLATKAWFKPCKMPTRKPNFISNSGSKYWYGNDKKGDYVIRYSDHWGAVASCDWRIKNEPLRNRRISFTEKSGKCYTQKFKALSA